MRIPLLADQRISKVPAIVLPWGRASNYDRVYITIPEILQKSIPVSAPVWMNQGTIPEQKVKWFPGSHR